MSPAIVGEKWWKNSIIYQIYPASFKDSNGDGIGDIQGIISSLDYITSLGVDVIWLCPMYDSPQIDMGYDISDYQSVYGPYGTVQDMETLIDACHRRGLRIILDLVVNHTSDQHRWFKESRSSKTDPKRNWYIWKPAKYDANGNRQPPNNWRSVFGGSAWEWDEKTQEYYLHLFCVEQPDVNWENVETRQAIYEEAMEFWLQKGVDGFRVDTVNMYSKSPEYANAPILDPKSDTQPAFDLFCNGPRIHEYMREMNEVLSKYDAMTVGELPNTHTIEGVLRYVSAAEKQLSMVFQFDLVDLGMGKDYKFLTTLPGWNLQELKNAIKSTQDLIKGTDAWTTVFMENHDQGRSVSRFGSDKTPELRVRSAKMLAMMQGTLSGTQFIYQGQEIGMVNAPREWTIDEYKDIDSTNYYRMTSKAFGEGSAELSTAMDSLQHLARDHARLPMQWSAEANAGFSPALSEKPWMRPHDNYPEINVQLQENDPSSVLSFWKQMNELRKVYADLLVFGEFDIIGEPNQSVFTYTKTSRNQTVLVVLNFSDTTQKFEKPESVKSEDWTLLASNVNGHKEDLEAFEGRLENNHYGTLRSIMHIGRLRKEMASPNSISRVPKACDPCNRRKVRCNGQQRCQQCEHLDLLCTYTENHLLRSRKHSLRRGAVISKYKSANPKTTALTPLLSPPLAPTISPKLPTSYFESLLPAYMSYVYPFSPIITDTEVRMSISKMDEREHAAFVYAFTAVTLDLTRSSQPINTSNPPAASTQITDLMRQSVETQQPLVIGFRPSILRATTSIFIQMCAMSLGHYDLGFFYLREAISMIQMLRISDKTINAGLSIAERARRQRLYWQCFIHERFMSIVNFSPVTLPPHTQFPEEDTFVGAGIQQGWVQVIKTFCMLDASFISLWIGDRTQVTASWVERKHRELDDELWEVEVSALSELQQADLVITRQWMRTLLWQMAMSNCLLSSHASCPSLELEMPLRLSSQLRQFLTKISQNTIRVHGSSMISKLLEIVNTIADVVIHVPQATEEDTTSRIDDIVFMQAVVLSFHNLQVMPKDILLDKFRLIRGRFPHIEVAMQLAV
ncbi:unnamed protein product [Penicillium glandicola]